MDDIALNPDYYDLFREPVLLMMAGAWLLLVVAFRRIRPRFADSILLAGCIVMLAVSWQPVWDYLKVEVPVLVEQSKAQWKSGSADSLRERDPVFGLLQIYLKSNPALPLAVLNDHAGETFRWAAYYLYPRPVILATPEGLANAVPAPGEPARYVLSRGTPSLPADLNIAIEGRVDDWLLFRVLPRVP
jgi:hypothetical protein